MAIVAMEQLVWRRSTRCDSNACVQMAESAAGVHVRDSKSPDGPTLNASRDQWAAFLGLIKNVDTKTP